MEELPKIDKKELLDMLIQMAKAYDNLPPGAMLSPITHYDFHSLLLMLIALFREQLHEEPSSDPSLPSSEPSRPQEPPRL